MTDFTDKDGTRIMDFQTPCGFEVALLRTGNGKLRTLYYFEHILTDEATALSRMSESGKILVDAKTKEIMS